MGPASILVGTMNPTNHDRSDDEDPEFDLADLLDRYRDWLLKFVEREARGLLRRESGDDLVGGVHLRALQQEEGFDYRSDEEFLGWLKLIARQQIADRHDYWKAQRRQATHMLRVTSRETTQGAQLEGKITGPETWTARREMMEIATRAITLLLPRDRQVVQMVTDGDSVAAVAKKINVSRAAAEQARSRAMRRFSKLVELLAKGEK